MFLTNILPAYFAGAFGSFFGLKTAPALAFRKLSSTSFESREKDRYAYRSVISGIRRIFNFPVRGQRKTFNSNTLIYDIDPAAGADRTAFLRYNDVKEPLDVLTADDLLHYDSSTDKLFFILASLPVQLHLLVFGLFKKDRSGLNALLKNLLICRNMLRMNVDFRKLHFYMFSIYDANSAFLSYCLMEKGTMVSQVTSEVPLYKWNHIILTDELILCSAYQQLELAALKETLRYKSVKLFSPESFYKIAHLYTQEQPKNKSVGFYSTGGWVRTKLGHIDQGTDLEKNEAKILSDLDAILKEKKELSLIVYPHPREWDYARKNNMDLFDHYRTLIPSASFRLQEPGVAGNTLFDDTYVAVCYMTTLIFERAHAGRRSVIAYYKEKGFPLAKSSGALMIVGDKSELRQAIATAYYEQT